MTKRRTCMLALVTSILLAVLLVPPVAGAQTGGAGGADPAVPKVSRPELQAVMDAMTSDTVTAFLTEVNDEHGHWVGTSGVADLGRHRPVPPDGRFRVGSVTKTFVATVILQLVGEGRLTLDDTVEHWLPGVVPGGDKITVRELLNHTSGTFNYTDDDKALPLLDQRFLDQVRFRTYSPLELVKIATAHPLNFAPGTSWSYSNTNYILAGLIIEKVTGHPWADEVTRRIIEPLGLRHTEAPDSAAIRGPHAHGYMLLYNGRKVRTVDITEINPSWVGSAGSIISTTGDLDHFFTALFAGQLLHPAELAAMTTTVDTHAGFRYGLALFEIPLPCGVTLWGHEGSVAGYITIALQTRDGRRRLEASINPILDRAATHLNDIVLTEFCGSTSLRPQSSLPLHAAMAIR